MKYSIFAVRDTCAEAFHMPMFFVNKNSAVRGLGDAVNRQAADNAYYAHPEHYALYEIGVYDDEVGVITPFSQPIFVVDCQSLTKS